MFFEKTVNYQKNLTVYVTLSTFGDFHPEVGSAVASSSYVTSPSCFGYAICYCRFNFCLVRKVNPSASFASPDRNISEDMSTGMPELGSKISLISKADIRYEGRLFTVDPQECTIALASVRSFGTEDRDTSYPVAPQNQVYDYILFRGSDIKDIRVVNNVQTLPNDPAIMQLTVPPSLGPQQFQAQAFQHPVLGHMGPQMGQFGAGYTMGLGAGMAPGMSMSRDPRMPTSKPSELIAPSLVPPTDLSSAVEPPRPNDHDLIGGGSRSTTPASLGSRKSPTADQGVQVSGAVKKDDKKLIRPIQPPGQRGPGNIQRERRDSRGDQHQHQDYQAKPQVNNQRKDGHQNQQYQQQTQQQRNHTQQQQYPRQRQGGWIPRGNVRQRGRSRGGYKPPQTGPTPQTNQQGSKPKNTLKFDNDYDFEEANTHFEEMIRNKLGKMKLDEGKPEMNGDSDKKDDSGNETGAGEGEQEEEHEVYYDKSKSFFDNISCEAVERSKGRSQRTDWRTERKLNSETFGVAATRRGGYRGRAGYRGMGYRGGYRGGYRNQPTRRDLQSGGGGGNVNRPQQIQTQPKTNNQTSTSASQPKTTTAPVTGK